MGHILLHPKCGPNIVKNTKKPLYLLPTGKLDSQEIDQCFELKDGRIIANVNFHNIFVYNLLNPTLVDIKIEHSIFNNNRILNIYQLDDGILIFSGYSSDIRLIQLESKSYKIIRSINMHSYLTDCSVNSCCKLSNGQLAFSLYSNFLGSGAIALLGYDSFAKNLIYYYQFELTGLQIYKIIECKNDEVLLIRKSLYNKEYEFFNLKKQKTVLTLERKQICDPIKLNENFILFENLEKIEIINLDTHTIFNTIDLVDLGYKYAIRSFLKFDDYTLFVGDYVGNIYKFSINFYDTINLNFIEVFRADESSIDILAKYQGNKLISTSNIDENIKIWDLSLLNNDNNLLNYYY